GSSSITLSSVQYTKAESITLTASRTSGDTLGTSASSSPITINAGAIASYTVGTVSPRAAGSTINVTVTAKDSFNNTVTTDSSTVVTMSGTGSVQFDSNGDATFGDSSKSLFSGTFTISAKDNAAEIITITATDGNSKTGSSAPITV